MNVSLIVAAGGSGSRFLKGLKKTGNASLAPKVFQSLAGKPMLFRTIEAFQKIPEIKETLVAVPQGAQRDLVKVAKKQGLKRVSFIAGGKTRASSVQNALRHAHKKSNWVMVHDGARPLISVAAVRKVLKQAKKTDAVILAKKVVPTIKRVNSQSRVLETLDRSVLYEAETPQLAKRSFLEKAYKQSKHVLDMTDEASLIEGLNGHVKVVVHEDWNPKITTLQDMKLAEAHLQSKHTISVRTGCGRDLHRLVLGRKLYVGGVVIPSPKGALGHSDGDVLLHAISDALLGTIGAGDIGDWFSDKNPKHKNIASKKIVQAIMKKVRAHGYFPTHVDSVILLERPKLGKLKKKIQQSVAKLLGMSPEDVSIKAKTNEGLGAEGEGLAISCEAIVTVKGGNA